MPEHLPGGRAALSASGAALVDVERGGSVTYHGPGQLVAYPILRLDRRGRDVHRYVRQLEESLVGTLRGFALEGRVRPGLTGVWVGPEKIAAIGIHVRHWVTMHGLSLNICPDLSRFAAVAPCGLDARLVTSMERLLGKAPPWSAVEQALVDNLGRTLGSPVEEIELTALQEAAGLVEE